MIWWTGLSHLVSIEGGELAYLLRLDGVGDPRHKKPHLLRRRDFTLDQGGGRIDGEGATHVPTACINTRG